MSETILISIAGILLFGIGAQWIAWRFHLPAILLLLVAGILMGPIFGFLDPDRLFQDLLLPLVSLSVAVILFEGGLTLRFAEIKETGSVVWRLVIVGSAVTWVLSTALGAILLGLSLNIAVLFGAILVVTGPTVILPLLRHVRPNRRVGSVVKWEGIVNDPIGAILAVLVFEAILAGGLQKTGGLAAVGVVKALAVGIICGLAGAGILVLLLKRFWIPDFLETPVTLVLVIASFLISNRAQADSGLLAVTLMGILIANQKWVSVGEIVKFKETLRLLLVSCLFIVLSARLDIRTIESLDAGSFAFVVLLIVLVRPLAVICSTLGTGVDFKDKIFMMMMAPRGIVAASVAAVFSLRLAGEGIPSAEMLVPYMFLVIVGTVTVYGLLAAPVARKLRLAVKNPQGCLILGAGPWARDMAKILRDQKIPVMLADSNRVNTQAARMEALPAYRGNILAENIFDTLDLEGIGRFLALLSNDGVNSLACIHFLSIFDKNEVYQLPPESDGGTTRVTAELQGRLLFGNGITHSEISRRYAEGARIKLTPITREFDYETFQKTYKDNAAPLFLIDRDKRLKVFTADQSLSVPDGSGIISLVGSGVVMQSSRPHD
ncbi:cation:proton antiporter [bacterium]|nr:cation:proton antiporter [bacterium]